MEEWSGAVAADATGAHNDGTYEPGVARWLDGPPLPAFSGEGAVNRCPHFAGGSIKATLKELGDAHTIELWFWNGLPEKLRPVTGTLVARGAQESLALGGTSTTPGALVFGGTLIGRTAIAPKTWNHIVLVREGRRIAVYLNGSAEPEIAGEAAPCDIKDICIGGGGDKNASFEGKIDEVAIYGRALSADEIRQHYQLGTGGQP
jgi:hypothetical protein